MTPEAFRALTASNTHPSLLLSVDGRVLAVNRAAIRELRADPEEIEGRALQDLVTDAPDRVEEALAIWRSSGTPTARTLRFALADHGVRTRCEGFLVTAIGAEPESRVLLHCLPARPVPPRVSARPSASSTARRVGKMEAMGNLAAGVAHDLNNLLTVIKAELELAQEHPTLADNVRESLTAAHVAVARAEELAGGLLAFSRRQLVRLVELDLARLVEEVMEGLAPRIEAPGVDLELEHWPHPLFVMVDRRQIQAVIHALVWNAREALPAEGGFIRVRTRSETLGRSFVHANPGSTPGRYAVLEVEDGGSGIPPEIHARLFEPFFTTRGRGAGRGLGLAQSYGIVKALGGYIRVESEPGAGAAFSVYLPRAGRG